MIGRSLAVACLGVLLMGCANGDGIIDLGVAPATNLDSKALVKITLVTDKRIFSEGKPSEHFIAWLNRYEFGNAAIASRAMAKIPHHYFQAAAWQTILLPEGRTVAHVTREALTRALQESGYRVVTEGEPGHDEARALTATVTLFWAWLQSGAWSLAIYFQAYVLLDEAWPVEADGHDLRASARVEAAMASTGVWEEAFQEGLANLIENLKGALKPPANNIN